MRIVLVNPCVEHQIQRHRHGIGHLGLGYVAATLLRDGHDVRVVDAKNESLKLPAVVERINGLSPALVGVTAMTHEITCAARLCAAVKQTLPDCITVVGGPHATALARRTISEFASIDVAVHGEGEQTICELSKAIESGQPRTAWANIRGIAFRGDSDVILTPARPPIEDLDSLPFPAWQLFPRPRRGWPIYAGRGCPFRCSFCQRVLGSRIRMRSVDNVMAEIDAMEESMGLRTSWFQDETFGVDRRWTHDILDRLIERNDRRGYVWKWKANSRANLADVELYRKMQQAGCVMLDFGVESGDERVLKRIHKSISLAQARKAIAAARSAGLRTNAFFIIGHPGETWRSALRTVTFAPRLGADSIAVGVMVPYPGTEIWDMAQRGEGGYKLLTENWDLYDKYFGNALELEGLSHRRLELLQAMTYVAFYLGRGRLHDFARFAGQFRKEMVQMVKRLLLPQRLQDLTH